MRLLIVFLFSFICSQYNNVYGQTWTMMTFNIKYDNPADGENAWDQRKLAFIDLVRHYQPDILGIQEGLLHQVNFIEHHLPNYTYIGVGRDDGKKNGEYAAIYYDTTKFSLISQKTFWLSESPDSVSVGWDAAMKRICTYGKFRVKANEDTLHIFNAHFDHMGSEARTQSARLVLRKIAEYGIKESSLVVMGDFNAPPDSEPIQILKKEMDYGPGISGSEFTGPTGTYNAFDLSREIGDPIDYIFTKNLEVVKYQHINDKKKNGYFISDHFPVWIEVMF